MRRLIWGLLAAHTTLLEISCRGLIVNLQEDGNDNINIIVSMILMSLMVHLPKFESQTYVFAIIRMFILLF